MKYVLELGILGIVVAICSFVLTYMLIGLLPKLGIIDVPSARRVHLKEVPRGGGLGFVLLFSLSFPVFEYIIYDSFLVSIQLLQIFLPISFISFLDDISHVMVSVRLFIHALCACLAIMWFVHPSAILHYTVPMNVDLFIGVFALLTFLNVYNFLDGIDGITTSESIHLSCTILLLCFLQYDIIPNADLIIMITTIILCWSFGFIYFNWQPAKIFLGDVGSISIGFLLGICLLTIASASVKLFIACVIAALYYVADGGLTILIRLSKGERIWEPHLQHFFQKAVSNGQSHKQVVKRIIICNILLMLLALGALYYPLIALIGAILVVTVTLIRSII